MAVDIVEMNVNKGRKDDGGDAASVAPYYSGPAICDWFVKDASPIRRLRFEMQQPLLHPVEICSL